MKKFILLSCMTAVTYLSAGMSPAQMKQILNITKDNWVSFRNYNGKQLLYFTHLESYTCGIKEVRYGLNHDILDRVWLLQPCDPKNPLAIKKDIVYLTMPLGYANSVAVQVTFSDGTKSELVHKEP